MRNRQLGWIALVVISVSLAAGLLLTLFSWALEHVIALEDGAIFGELNAVRLLYFCTSLYVAWSLLYFGIKFMRDAAERDLRLAKAEAARRIEALSRRRSDAPAGSRGSRGPHAGNVSKEIFGVSEISASGRFRKK